MRLISMNCWRPGLGRAQRKGGRTARGGRGWCPPGWAIRPNNPSLTRCQLKDCRRDAERIVLIPDWIELVFEVPVRGDVGF